MTATIRRLAPPFAGVGLACLMLASTRSVHADGNWTDVRGELRRLFPKEADIFIAPGASRLARLELSQEVLSACRSDLSDLRVLDRAGAEVPFLIDRAGEPLVAPALTRRGVARILHARQSQQKRERGPSVVREQYELALPAEAPVSGSFVLVFESPHGHFVRRVDLDLLDGGRANPLLEGGSVFRLPRSGAEQLRLSLPSLPPSAPSAPSAPSERPERRLRVTLTGEGEGPLEPKFYFESVRSFAARRELAVTLSVLSRARVGTRTIVELRRPGGIVPSALRLQTPTPAFDRLVDIYDVRPGGHDVRVGRATLFRVAAIALVEKIEARLKPTTGEHLRVEIEDGDSQTLESLGFSAVIQQPTLIFAAPAAASGAGAAPSATLCFGGGRAHLPRYDLAGLLPASNPILEGARAQAAASLYDQAQLRSSHLGAVRQNGAYDSTPALAFAMRAGAQVDGRRYSHERVLELAPSPDGLARLQLEPADVAIVRPDVADLRIVDAESRQWPYLLEREGAGGWVELRVRPLGKREQASRYRLELPVEPLALEALEFTADDPYFDRAYQVTAVDVEGREVSLAAGRLVRGPIDRHAGALSIGVSAVRAKSIALSVEDGANAPLELRAVRGRVKLPVLYVAAPAGAYSLLIGNPEDSPPLYDIARAKALVLAVASAPNRLGPLRANHAFRRHARLAGDAGSLRLALWAALGLAVVALGALTLRLARKEEKKEKAEKEETQPPG